MDRTSTRTSEGVRREKKNEEGDLRGTEDESEAIWRVISSLKAGNLLINGSHMFSSIKPSHCLDGIYLRWSAQALFLTICLCPLIVIVRPVNRDFNRQHSFKVGSVITC